MKRRLVAMERVLVLSLGSGVLLAIGWIMFLSRQAAQPKQTFALKAPVKLVVIAPHPDDELAIAGGLMIQNAVLGGSTHIIFITNGDAYLGGRWRTLYAIRRKREARSAMKILGIPRRNIVFLGFQDDFDALDKLGAAKIQAALKQELLRLKPDMVFTSAYEGGHCMHDLANALTARAMQDFPSVLFYESTEYNPYFGLDTPLKTFQPFVNVLTGLLPGAPNLRVGPRFIPASSSPRHKETAVYQTVLTSTEHKRKLTALKSYSSQNILRQALTKRFGKGEVFRQYPGYDYQKPPLNFSRSLNFRLCQRWLGGTRPGKWLLHQYGTPSWGSWTSQVAGKPSRGDEAGACEQYSVCNITHSEFSEKIPN